MSTRLADNGVDLRHYYSRFQEVNWNHRWYIYTVLIATHVVRSRGVMVSTLDFESKDPSSSLGGTSSFLSLFFFFSPSHSACLVSFSLFFFLLFLCLNFAGVERETF